MRLPLVSDQPTATQEKGSFAFVSLGCPKNLVDTERMLGKLAQDGYTFQSAADGADVVVVNTCGFIEPARQESLAVIRDMVPATDLEIPAAEVDDTLDTFAFDKRAENRYIWLNNIRP